MTFFIFMAIIGIENFIFCAIIMAGVENKSSYKNLNLEYQEYEKRNEELKQEQARLDEKKAELEKMNRELTAAQTQQHVETQQLIKDLLRDKHSLEKEIEEQEKLLKALS